MREQRVGGAGAPDDEARRAVRDELEALDG